MRHPAATIAAAISAAFNGRSLAVLALVAPFAAGLPEAAARETHASASHAAGPAKAGQRTAPATARPAAARKTSASKTAAAQSVRTAPAARIPHAKTVTKTPPAKPAAHPVHRADAVLPAEGAAPAVSLAALAAGAGSGPRFSDGPSGVSAVPAPGAGGRLVRAAARGVAAAALATSALAGTPAALAAPAATAPAQSDLVSLNFVNADLDAVVGAIGQMTNRTFIVDPRVRGQVTLATPNPVPRAEAYRMLLSVLRLQGFAVVEDGAYAKVLPEADAKLQSGPVAGLTPGNRGDQVVTQIFRLNYESASAMVPVLRPLISPNNTITAYPSNNSLVITDYAENIRRIERIIANVDVPAAAELEVIPLKYGLAVDMAALLTRMLDDSQRGGQTDPGQKVTIMADQRSNALLLRASSKARADSVRSLVAKLDIPSAGKGNINVVYLKNADAVRLAATLRSIITADGSSAGGQTGSSGSSFLSSGSGSGGSASGGSGGIGGNTGGLGGNSGGSSGSGFGGSSGGSSGSGFGSSSSSSGFGSSSSGSSQQGGIVQADPATNTLIITAPEPIYRNLRDIIEKLDARRAQVYIEALIVEVSADKSAEFGIQWQDLSGLNGSGTNVIGGTNFGSSGTNILTAAANVASVGQGLNLGLVRGTITIAGTTYTNFGLLARALETNTNANVLSTPNLLTLDNEEAKIVVGQNVPFITGQYSNSSSTSSSSGTSTVNPFQTIERKDVGLTLHVKPAVSEGGGVRMQIHQEVSNVVSTSLAAGIITNTRQIDSSVVVDDGQIIVLGGLVQDEITDSVSKVPLLGDIPYLGALFRYSNRERKKTNLMVFLRPRIIRNLVDSQSVTVDRYDYMRVRTSEQQPAPSFILPDTRGMQMPALDGSFTIKSPAMLMQPAPGDARTPESAITPQGGGANAAGQPSQKIAPTQPQ
ncbi:type II secretion system secretin GspD [Derxia lacustris]|uniref:type II secretion system secretin GspD n=1 Tax=Derxia lacustris TaxID=764842 RepID=UPI000A1725CB|nr:type II secretion system secretin GspD [Derxia lacustris]